MNIVKQRIVCTAWCHYSFSTILYDCAREDKVITILTSRTQKCKVFFSVIMQRIPVARSNQNIISDLSLNRVGDIYLKYLFIIHSNSFRLKQIDM